MFKGKKVLITAGPTWVSIDPIRVISNISSGLTGSLCAQYAVKNGADVTLLLGPSDANQCLRLRQGYDGQVQSILRLRPEQAFRLSSGQAAHKLKIIKFKYFDELQKLIHKQLAMKKYDIIIQAAAISDYKPAKVSKQKIKSNKKGLRIFLRPTVKLIEQMRKYAPQAYIVMFKLESGVSDKKLIDIAYKDMFYRRADLIVANDVRHITKYKHRAYIIDREKNAIRVNTKKGLVEDLFKEISKRI